MAFTKSADGVAKKGKTSVNVMTNDGPKVAPKTAGKKSSGVTSEAMMKVGRNLARANNQKRG
jgi:hypothetical protein